jgi:cell division protein FtsB
VAKAGRYRVKIMAGQKFITIMPLGRNALAKSGRNGLDSAGQPREGQAILLREIKNRFLALIPPAIFLGITWYFGWNSVHGARGLEAQAQERAELAKAQAQFATVDATRQLWETRIADLSNQSVAPDMLDDQARAVLNLANPQDLVVELPAPAAK